MTSLNDRERNETVALFQSVKAREQPIDFREIVLALADYVPELPRECVGTLVNTVMELLHEEECLAPVPDPDFAQMNLRELTEYRQRLFTKRHFLDNQDHCLALIHDTFVHLILNISIGLPVTADPSPFRIPLIFGHAEPRVLVSQLVLLFTTRKATDRGLFKSIGSRLTQNTKRASGRVSEGTKNKPLIDPTESALDLPDLVDAYLGGTPLHTLLMMPLPLKLTRDDRMDHMHIIGGTGSGKTSLIENLVLHDLRSEDPPSLVIIDPHGDLIQRLVHADLGLGDRLILIDPRDINHPPALNIFALNQVRLESYDEATREQVTAGVIQTFDYLFSGLLGADLTAKQGVFFRYVARLMLALPDALGRNATILDMLRLMSDPTPYLPAINHLPDIPREFFLNDFQTKTFAQTKEQIRYRLQAILENPTMARLFTSPETKVDLFTEINRGAVILVDTAKDFLKSASPNFGRIFISLLLQAVLERSAIAPEKRKDTFLIVDEAASYFDSNIDDLLTDARKYRCGIVLAHQYLDQASSSLRASLAANTGAKFASGLSSGDARTLASDLRTSADFILGQPKLQFAAHIRNVTPHAVSIPVTPGAIEREPRLSQHAFEALLARNRNKVALSQQEAPSPKTSTPKRASPATPDEDISSEW